jgi:hypothetical protein
MGTGFIGVEAVALAANPEPPSLSVMPAEAGIQQAATLDSRLRGNDTRAVKDASRDHRASP